MRTLLVIVLAWASLLTPASEGADLSDSEVRLILIQQSLAAYRGNCPCPENVDRAGRRCGARSAYSKRGGQAPLCYPHDVTEDMIREFRGRVGS